MGVRGGVGRARESHTAWQWIKNLEDGGQAPMEEISDWNELGKGPYQPIPSYVSLSYGLLIFN